MLEGKDLEGILVTLYRGAIDDLVQKSAADGIRGQALAERLGKNFAEEIGLPEPKAGELPVKEGGDACCAFLWAGVEKALSERKAGLGEVHDHVLRYLLLDSIDRRWKDQIYAMEHLRHAIGLEAYAQKDPRIRYKEEGYRRFDMMNELIRLDVARLWFRLQVQVKEPEQPAAAAPQPARALAAGGFAAAKLADHSTGAKPGPNAPCPCGSGQPFKRCHGP